MTPSEPLPGLMMDIPLTTQRLLWRLRTVHGDGRVSTVIDESGACVAATYREVVTRAERLAAAMRRLGVRPGDRVASLAWNTQQHLEAYYAIMSMGAVLHTVNLRLHPDQVEYTVNHAQDKVLLLDASLAEQFAAVLPRLSTVEHIVVIGDLPAGAELPGSLDYETLLDAEEPGFAWPHLDENAAASLCYTSGTTGDPKGVLYSHRAIVLHALSMSGADCYGLTSRDRVLSTVPMFHAMGWGLPFVCAVTGADLVMPSRFLRRASVTRVIAEQGITWSCGVPTVWMDILQHLNQSGSGDELRTLRTVISGGTRVPENLMREYDSRFGVNIRQGWGMTEIFPGAALVADDPDAEPDKRWRDRAAAGRISPLYELRVVSDDGSALPHDGEAVGEVEVRGPAVASGYHAADAHTADAFHDGWLRTGDLGTIDRAGTLRIVDRLKDAVKSGGEWISTVGLEAALMGHPAVLEAAVIGRPDERWGERPVAFVVLKHPVEDAELKSFLAGRVARWWIPQDMIAVASLPRTSTGKFDKRALRTQESNPESRTARWASL